MPYLQAKRKGYLGSTYFFLHWLRCNLLIGQDQQQKTPLLLTSQLKGIPGIFISYYSCFCHPLPRASVSSVASSHWYEWAHVVCCGEWVPATSKGLTFIVCTRNLRNRISTLCPIILKNLWLLFKLTRELETAYLQRNICSYYKAFITI